MPPNQPTLRSRIAHALFGDVIQQATAQAVASVSVRVDDTPGWNRLAPAGPFERLRTGSHDRDFAEWYQDQEDALEAWRKNFNEQQVCCCSPHGHPGPLLRPRCPHGLCAAESTISSNHAYLQSFVAAFAAHPKNRLAERYGPICDELTRAGEIFPVLFGTRSYGEPFRRRRQRHRACPLRPRHPDPAHETAMGPSRPTPRTMRRNSYTGNPQPVHSEPTLRVPDLF